MTSPSYKIGKTTSTTYYQKLKNLFKLVKQSLQLLKLEKHGFGKVVISKIVSN